MKPISTKWRVKKWQIPCWNSASSSTAFQEDKSRESRVKNTEVLILCKKGGFDKSGRIIWKLFHFHEHPSCKRQQSHWVLRKRHKVETGWYTKDSFTRSPLWGAGTTQTCCSPNSLDQKTLGASWNWLRWSGWSTWKGAWRDLQRDKRQRKRFYISYFLCGNSSVLRKYCAHLDPKTLKPDQVKVWIFLNVLFWKTMTCARTFCSIRCLNLLWGRTRLLDERLRRVRGVLDHFGRRVFLLQQTLQPSEESGVRKHGRTSFNYKINRVWRKSGKATKCSHRPDWPLRVLPAFVFCLFAAVFLRPVFPLLSLPPPLLPLLLLWRFAATGDDALQNSLVSVGGAGVRFHQRFQLVPHYAVLLVPGGPTSDNVTNRVTTAPKALTSDLIPLGAFASWSYGGNRERVVLPLHVDQVVNGFLAG